MGKLNYHVDLTFGLISQRYYICLMSFVGLTLSYVMRFCISIAITEMIRPIKSAVDPHACPADLPSPKINITTEVEDESLLLDWSEQEQGLVLSSFFWGYLLTQVPGGMVADNFGPRRVLVVSVLFTALFTFLTPVATFEGGVWGLVAVRVLLGLAQGCFYASLHTVVAVWVPSQERGLWGTLVFSGAHMGNFVSNLCSGIMLNAFRPHWEYLFYIWGFLGTIWGVIFFFTTYDSYKEIPSISQSEIDILDAYYVAVSKKAKVGKTPWKSILKSLPVWAILVAMVGHDWGLFAVVVDIPKFMKSVLRFNVTENGMYVAMGYLSLCIVAIICGKFVDHIDRKNLLSRTWNRIIFTTIASVGPSIGLLGVSYAAKYCYKMTSVLFLIFGLCTLGTFYPSLKVNPIDLSPNHAGTIGAMAHTVGALAGIIVPYLIGTMVPGNTWSEWNNVWWLMFIVMSITNVFYIVFGSGKSQPWNVDGVSTTT